MGEAPLPDVEGEEGQPLQVRKTSSLWPQLALLPQFPPHDCSVLSDPLQDRSSARTEDDEAELEVALPPVVYLE